MFRICTGALARTAIVVTTTGAASLALSSPASAVNLTQYIDVPRCEQPQTQWCTPIPKVRFTTLNEGSVKVEFTANQNHCADMIAHIFMDGLEWGSNRVGPGQSDGGYEIPVTRGHHIIGVQAEGIEGGCNTGFVSAWGGTIHIVSLQDPYRHAGPPPA